MTPLWNVLLSCSAQSISKKGLLLLKGPNIKDKLNYTPMGTTWDILALNCWINKYQDPPQLVVTTDHTIRKVLKEDFVIYGPKKSIAVICIQISIYISKYGPKLLMSPMYWVINIVRMVRKWSFFILDIYEIFFKRSFKIFSSGIYKNT